MKTLSLGIGCRQNTSAGEIEAAVRAALGPLSFDDISSIATLDIKAREPGLIEFCTWYSLPLLPFSRAEIDSAPGPRTPSAASAHLGIEGVCEPCALLAAPGGHLLVPKRVLGGVTVAIASNASTPANPAEPNP
jgi:cobalt-precorrin 5A hydrolase